MYSIIYLTCIIWLDKNNYLYKREMYPATDTKQDPLLGYLKILPIFHFTLFIQYVNHIESDWQYSVINDIKRQIRNDLGKSLHLCYFALNRLQEQICCKVERVTDSHNTINNNIVTLAHTSYYYPAFFLTFIVLLTISFI